MHCYLIVSSCLLPAASTVGVWTCKPPTAGDKCWVVHNATVEPLSTAVSSSRVHLHKPQSVCLVQPSTTLVPPTITPIHLFSLSIHLFICAILLVIVPIVWPICWDESEWVNVNGVGVQPLLDYPLMFSSVVLTIACLPTFQPFPSPIPFPP